MKPLSRARAREVDTIVAGIVDLMTRGKWVTGRSHQELAQAHGVSVSRVEDWATEAARCLRVMGLVDRESVIAQHRAHIAERASRFVRIADAAEDVTEFGPAIAALNGWGAENDREARLLGLNAPEKHEHAHTQAQAEWEKLPPVERPAWLRAQAARFLAAAEAAEEELRDAAALTVGVAKE